MRMCQAKCDRCEEIIKHAGKDSEIQVFVGRSMDASGNGYSDDIVHVDFCLDCCAKFISELSHTHSISDQIFSFRDQK